VYGRSCKVEGKGRLRTIIGSRPRPTSHLLKNIPVPSHLGGKGVQLMDFRELGATNQPETLVVPTAPA